MTKSESGSPNDAVLASAYAVFDQVSDAIVLLDTDGTCLFLNSKAEYVFNTQGNCLAAEMLQELMNAPASEFTIRTMSADGTEILLNVLASRIVWLGNDALLYTATVSDADAGVSARLEAAVAQTSSMLEYTLDSIDEVFMSLSDDLVVLDISDSIARSTHREPAHYIGEPLVQFIHEEDVPALNDLGSSPNGTSIQMRIHGANGGYRWMQCNFYEVQAEQGIDSSLLRGVMRDITVFKEMEHELHLTEQKHRTIFETAKTALVLFNSDMRITLVNAETEKLTGYSAAELTNGTPWIHYVADQDRERLFGYNETRKNDPTAVPDMYEFQLIRKDGQPRDVLIKTARIPGTQQGVASLIDISESKYRNMMYRTIVEQSLFGLMVVNDYHVQFANDHAVKMTGYSVDELKHLSSGGILSIISEAEREVLGAVVNGVLRGSSSQGHMLLHVIRKDGSHGVIDSFIRAIDFNGRKSILLLGLDVSDRYALVKQLRENEERYKIFSEVISDYAYTRTLQSDGSWKSEWVSDTIKKMVPDPENLERFTWAPYVVEADISAFKGHWKRTEIGESNVAEFRIHKPGGPEIWVREYVRPILNPDTGKVEKIYAVGQDITDRRVMRQALHEFERRFRVMLEHLSMISIILDVHGKLAFCNDYLLNLTGYGRDEVLSVNWFDTFIPAAARDQVKRVFDQTISDGEFPVNYEGEIITRKGEQRLISWTNTILRDTKGKIIGTASIGEDVTDRRVAEQRLRESEERYRQLFTIEPDALIVHDLQDKTIIEANDAALSLYGYTRDELVGMHMHNLSAEPEQTIRSIDEMPKLKRRKIPLRYHRRKDGTVFTVEISAGLFVHGNRELVYASIRDISERVHSERELIAAKERAELGDKLKDSFIANMSHEIRTPLNIILGYTGIIESDLGDALNEEQLDYFRSVERAGSRLQRTVEQLLNLSSLQVGTYSSKSEDIELCEHVDNLVYDMISLAHAKNIALEVLHEESPVHVFADSYLVDQALANILDNAIKFTDTGGVFVRLTVRGSFARVEVRDTGIGISEDYLPQIFTMFSQEVFGYTRPFDGLGIGLALTKMYMTEIGGEVHIQSIKGEGTVVALEFPLVNTMTVTEPSQEYGSQRNTAGRGKNVLVIEDDALTQKYMTIALQGMHNLTFAETTEDALNILSSTPTDIIILDLYMKGTFDGLHTATTIKSNSALADIPIVVVTAHEKPEDRLRCTEAGCSDFLLKPLHRSDLQEAIVRLTEKK